MIKSLLNNTASKCQIMAKVVLILGIVGFFAVAVHFCTDRHYFYDVWSFFDIILFAIVNTWKFLAIWISGMIGSYVVALMLKGIGENAESLNELKAKEI